MGPKNWRVTKLPHPFMGESQNWSHIWCIKVQNLAILTENGKNFLRTMCKMTDIMYYTENIAVFFTFGQYCNYII